MMSELNMSFVQQTNSATHSPPSQISNDITYRIKSAMVQFVTSHFCPNLISKCSPCPNVFIASEKKTLSSTYLEQICLCTEIFSGRVVQLDDACMMQLVISVVQMDDCTKNFGAHSAQMDHERSRKWSNKPIRWENLKQW